MNMFGKLTLGSVLPLCGPLSLVTVHLNCQRLFHFDLQFH